MQRCTYDYGPTLSTDGIQVHVPWQSLYTFKKKATEEEYSKYMKNQAKWAAEKEERIKNATRQDGTVDRRVSRKREPKILPPNQ